MPAGLLLKVGVKREGLKCYGSKPGDIYMGRAVGKTTVDPMSVRAWDEALCITYLG